MIWCKHLQSRNVQPRLTHSRWFFAPLERIKRIPSWDASNSHGDGSLRQRRCPERNPNHEILPLLQLRGMASFFVSIIKPCCTSGTVSFVGQGSGKAKSPHVLPGHALTGLSVGAGGGRKNLKSWSILENVIRRSQVGIRHDTAKPLNHDSMLPHGMGHPGAPTPEWTSDQPGPNTTTDPSTSPEQCGGLGSF